MKTSYIGIAELTLQNRWSEGALTVETAEILKFYWIFEKCSWIPDKLLYEKVKMQHSFYVLRYFSITSIFKKRSKAYTARAFLIIIFNHFLCFSISCYLNSRKSSTKWLMIFGERMWNTSNREFLYLQETKKIRLCRIQMQNLGWVVLQKMQKIFF